jgi:galactokinase/mevalonate kinase-like predicted kinase
MVFNEPVVDSAEAVMHLKNSLGYQDTSLICEQASESGGDITYANMNKFVQCVDFGYTNEKFLDGISSNSPIELIVETRTAYASGTVMMHSFTEMHYNLSIKKGMVTYVEPKPGVGNVY